MKIFIDCEFNGHRGELISMALVDENALSWYGILFPGADMAVGPWVMKNVMPVLIGKTSPDQIFYDDPESLARGIERFLAPYASVELIADWPADIQYFCEALIYAPGERVDTPALTMIVDRKLDTNASLVPHNALADAVALREMYMKEPNQIFDSVGEAR